MASGTMSGLVECEQKAVTPRRENITQQLQRRHDTLVEQLADVDAALKLFGEHPDLLQAFDLIGQIGSIRL